MVRNAFATATAVALAVIAGSGAPLARADNGDEGSPWDQGRISLSITLASEQAFGESYFLAGGGLGYFILPGFELAFRGVHWFGGDPSISVVSPEARYIAVPLGWPVLPYLGGFYTHYFVGDPFSDYDTIGGRLGLVFHQRGSRLLFGAGAAVERVVSDCSEDCTALYPEVSIGFTF